MDLPPNYMSPKYKVHAAFLLSTILQNHAKPNLYNTRFPKNSTIHRSCSSFNCSITLQYTAVALK